MPTKVKPGKKSQTTVSAPHAPESLNNSGSGKALEITAERQPVYGHPALNFQRCAMVWNGLLANKLITPITAEEVAIMMNGVKLARLVETPNHSDSADDVDGYTCCLRQVVDVRSEGINSHAEAGIHPASLVSQALLLPPK